MLGKGQIGGAAILVRSVIDIGVYLTRSYEALRLEHRLCSDKPILANDNIRIETDVVIFEYAATNQ